MLDNLFFWLLSPNLNQDFAGNLLVYSCEVTVHCIIRTPERRINIVMFIQEAQYGHAHIKTSTWPSSIQEAPYNNVHTGGSKRPASYMRFGMVMHIQGDSTWSCSYSRLNMAMLI